MSSLNLQKTRQIIKINNSSLKKNNLDKFNHKNTLKSHFIKF